MSLCAKMKKLKICRLEFSHPDNRRSIDNLMIIDAFLFLYLNLSLIENELFLPLIYF